MTENNELKVKERIGIVVSNKPNKTIIVSIQTRYQHAKYGKILVKTKRYMAHDEENSCESGDLVILEDCAPISKNKKWKLKKIVKKYRR
jgi:small subunit ribosomal protein S17